MKNALLFIVVTLLSTATFASNSVIPANNSALPSLVKVLDWEKLSSRKVNFRLDRDVVTIGVRKGKFTKLKLQVTGGSLNMRKMVVEYGNGEKETIQLKHKFGKGKGSRIIDLNGGKRIIKDITFWYDSKNVRGQKATLHVFGKH